VERKALVTHYASDNPNGWLTGKRFSIDEPFVTVMAEGAGGDSRGHWHLHQRDDEPSPSAEQAGAKPPYRVPAMAEIQDGPLNGYTVASTFSGCGGSCLGYRMAGFRVAWANEFVKAACETYAANFPDTLLDSRDIRDVTAAEILDAIGMEVGELDLFDGSPPCQAFSTAGTRERGWGTLKRYDDADPQLNEDMFFEYLRLLQGLQPRMFIAENVSGLIKGTAKGYFKRILAGMKAAGYRVEARLLDAQWLGVPQQRQRIIFMGVRNDLDAAPCFPSPLPYRYSVRDALPWIVSSEYDPRGQFTKHLNDGSKPHMTITTSNIYHLQVEARDALGVAPDDLEMIVGNDAFRPIWGTLDQPTPTIMSSGPHGGSGEFRDRRTATRRKFTIAELRRICGFPDDFILTGTYAQQWARLGNSVPPVMMAAIARSAAGVLGRVDG